MFYVGDLIEPRDDQTLLTPGLYKVITINAGSARLSRLDRDPEEDIEAHFSRITFVPLDILKMFNLARTPAD